jgi:hypothetical protein
LVIVPVPGAFRQGRKLWTSFPLPRLCVSLEERPQSETLHMVRLVCGDKPWLIPCYDSWKWVLLARSKNLQKISSSVDPVNCLPLAGLEQGAMKPRDLPLTALNVLIRPKRMISRVPIGCKWKSLGMFDLINILRGQRRIDIEDDAFFGLKIGNRSVIVSPWWFRFGWKGMECWFTLWISALWNSLEVVPAELNNQSEVSIIQVVDSDLEGNEDLW